MDIIKDFITYIMGITMDIIVDIIMNFIMVIVNIQRAYQFWGGDSILDLTPPKPWAGDKYLPSL